MDIFMVYTIAGITFLVVMQVTALFEWDKGYKVIGAWFLFAILHALLRIEANIGG